MVEAGAGTEFWRRVRAALEEALDRAPAERAAFLEEHCAGDAALRAEVDRLLELESQPGPDLDPPTPTAFAELLPGAPPPPLRRVGPYTVVRELGSGGMGTVWLAERADGAFSRQVAVKVLRPGLASSSLLARFHRERQLLAELDHPGIARLYEGGATEDGLPYLVMEHVEGLPIDRWADEHRLGTRERVALFRKVCAAVHGAHQRLIVHRDLKPSNVLVDAAGEPRLLDFGIAKMLDPERGEGDDATLPEQRPMTPAYASPEQVRGGAITTASDVYSLGVLLYRLLTGDLPHRVETGTLPELERLLAREPRRPSTVVARAGDDVARARRTSPRGLQRQLEGDLDHVVLCALRRDPERRYASVAELSDDLGRYLEGLPVRAGPDTVLYRVSKFVARNRVMVSAAVLVFALLAAGLVFSTLQYRRADRAGQLEAEQRELAERRLGEVGRLADDLDVQRAEVQARLEEVEALNLELEERRAEAEARFRDAFELARTLTFDVGRDLLAIPGTRDVIAQVTEKGSQYLDRLVSLAADDDEMARELVLSYLRLADLHSSTSALGRGTLAAAEEDVARAVALAEELFARSPDDQANAYMLAQSLIQRAAIHNSTGRPAERLRDLERALEVGATYADEERLKAGFAWSLQEVLTQLASMELTGGTRAGLERLLAEAEGYLERAEGLPERARRTELCQHDKLRGDFARSRGDWRGALEAFEAAREHVQPLLDARPGDPYLREIEDALQLGVAHAQLELGMTREVIEGLQVCLERAEAALRADPRNRGASGIRAQALQYLAAAHELEGDGAAAAEALDRELAGRRDRLERDPADALARLELAEALRRTADFERRRAAHDALERLVEEGRALVDGKEDLPGLRRESGNLHLVRARSLRDRGRLEEARRAYDAALRELEAETTTWEGDRLPAMLDEIRAERDALAERGERPE